MVGYTFCERCGRPVLAVGQELCRECTLVQLPKPKVRLQVR